MLDTVATAAILYGISLAEGIRQLPTDAIVLRHSGVGRWRVVRHGPLGAGLHVVSWCLPLSVPLVLPSSAGSDARSADGLPTALGEYAPSLAALRLLGVLTLVVLVAGLPVAVERSGLFGLLVVGTALLILTATQAVWTRRMLRRQGVAPRPAVLAALKLLNPFSAPRAAEMVYASIAEGVPALDAARALLGEAELTRAFRPAIYDVVHARAARVDLRLTAEMVARFTSLLEAPPAGLSGSSFCPRCASEFAPTVARCSDCDDVALVQAGNG